MKSYLHPLFSTTSSLTVQTESTWSFEMCFSYDLLHLTHSESTAQVSRWQAQGLPRAWGEGERGVFQWDFSQSHHETKPGMKLSSQYQIFSGLLVRHQSWFALKNHFSAEDFRSYKGLSPAGAWPPRILQRPPRPWGGTVWGLNPLRHLFGSCPRCIV